MGFQKPLSKKPPAHRGHGPIQSRQKARIFASSPRTYQFKVLLSSDIQRNVLVRKKNSKRPNMRSFPS